MIISRRVMGSGRGDIVIIIIGGGGVTVVITGTVL